MRNRVLFIICVCVLCVFGLCGCKRDNSKEDEAGFKVYYLNKSEDKLMPVAYNLESTETDAAVKEVIDLLGKTSDIVNCINSVPEEVEIKDYDINDTTLTLNFSMDYLKMSKIREIMCRSAVVITMTQIPGIEYVAFNVENEPLKDSAAENVGPMKAADFVDSAGSSINNYQNIEVTLFFGNENGDMLVEKKLSKVYSENVSMERYILDSLIKGPGDDSIKRTIPEQTKVISVTTKDGTCYVNLGSSFLTDTVEVSDEVEIFSIVNSLCELTNVNKVQFSIEGDTDVTLHGKIDLSETFSRNLDICVQ